MAIRVAGAGASTTASPGAGRWRVSTFQLADLANIHDARQSPRQNVPDKLVLHSTASRICSRSRLPSLGHALRTLRTYHSTVLCR